MLLINDINDDAICFQNTRCMLVTQPVMARGISQVFETLCHLQLQGILLLVVEPGVLTYTCPQACLCLFH